MLKLIFQEFFNENIFFLNLTFGCYVVIVGVTSKPTDLPKSLSWFPWKPGHMTIPITFNKLKRGTVKLHFMK